MPMQSTNARGFLSDRRGNVAITFGLTSMIALGAVGGALDLGRAYKMKSHMQQVLDVAITSGLTKYKDSQDWTLAQATAQATFDSMIAGASSFSRDTPPTATFTNDGTTLTANASGAVNAPFINAMASAFGHASGTAAGTIAVSTTGAGALSGDNSSTSSQKKLELSIMVDLTGSMGWSDASSTYSKKVDALKAAGLDILDILLPPGGGQNDYVRIAIAPFADFVNAGQWAPAATGMAESGGAYSNRENLGSTKNGQFTGSYSGIIGSSAGSQAGVVNGSTSTFDNGFCANPNVVTTAAIRTKSSKRVGVEIDRDSWFEPTLTTADTTGLVILESGTSNSDGFKRIADIDGNGGNDWDDSVDFHHGSDNKGYFAPLPENPSSLTIRTRTANWSRYQKTGNVGVRVSHESGIDSNEQAVLEALGFKKASSTNRYWRLKKIYANGSHSYEWEDEGWYLPLFENMTTSAATTTCADAVVTRPSAKLISCVTERTDTTTRYTDAAPSAANGYVGPYSAKYSGKSDYSSDGKCHTAGRELAPIVPLTNQRGTLNEFFNSMKVGGATPGHLGTAWAWYLISPNWASVLTSTTGNNPAEHAPAAYDDPNVIKAAVLMSDGEYNVYYGNSKASAAQAMDLCTGMKAAGIKVYTIGFGMGANVIANQYGSTAQRAKYTLEQCASGAGYHFFPYDGDALRTAFTDIGNALKAEQNTVTVVKGARLTK